MRFWLIGCGSLAIIVIIFGVVGFKCVRDTFLDVRDDISFIVNEYKALDQEFPFEKPEDGILSSDEYARFTRCRTILLADLDAYFDKLEGEETSWRKKISLMVGMPSEIGRSHVEALREACLSPSAYEWFVNHTFLVLRYADHRDAPEDLKALKRDLEGLSWKDNPFAEERGDTFSDDTVGLDNILPPIDPVFIRLPKENVEAVLAHADTLRKTGRVIYFDATFLEMSIHTQDQENGAGSNK